MRRQIKLAAAVVGLVGLGATAGFASNTFTDVPAGRYYTNAVDWAFNNGVTTGTSATTFSPEGAVTRGQNVTFAYRYDQNVVQPALDEIDEQFDTLSGDVDDLDTDLDALAGDVDDLDTDLGTLAGDVAALDTLDELPCTATQVVINDNGWRCATPTLSRSYGLVVGVGTRTLLGGRDAGDEATSIAIGADGNPVISYQNDAYNALELYVCTDASCATGTTRRLLTGEGKGNSSSVAIGANGNPVVSHHDWIAGDLELYVCGDPACAGGTNQILIAAGIAGAYSSVAIGADGNPVISHYEGNVDLGLYACFDPICANGSNRTLLTGGDFGGYSSLTIGADGNPVISHRDGTNGDLELYLCADPTCTTGTNRELVTGNVGSHTSVAIGADGNPVISYHDPTNSGGLRLYVCADPTCTTGVSRELTPGGSNTGSHSSVAIGANGNPFISYYDPDNNGDLGLYVCADPTCTTGTSQPLGIGDGVGYHTSLAASEDGTLIVSHYNASDKELLIAVPVFAVTGIAYD